MAYAQDRTIMCKFQTSKRCFRHSQQKALSTTRMPSRVHNDTMCAVNDKAMGGGAHKGIHC
jgi:hypothetical protein